MKAKTNTYASSGQLQYSKADHYKAGASRQSTTMVAVRSQTVATSRTEGTINVRVVPDTYTPKCVKTS